MDIQTTPTHPHCAASAAPGREAFPQGSTAVGVVGGSEHLQIFPVLLEAITVLIPILPMSIHAPASQSTPNKKIL